MKSIEPLVENRQRRMLAENAFFKNKTLSQDATYLPESCAAKSNKLFSDRNRAKLIYTNFLKEDGIFFPNNRWNHYISISGDGCDISLVKESAKDNRITWIQSGEMYDIMRSLKESPSQFIESYNKLLNTIPKSGSTRNENAFWYSNLKRNLVENHRNSVDEAAFTLFLLHASSQELTESTKLRNDSYWSKKVHSLQEWSNLLKDVSLLNKSVDRIPKLTNKSFVYTDYDFVENMSEGHFIRSYEDMNQTYFCSLAVQANKGSYLHEEFSRRRDWNVYSINTDKVMITNYNLKKLQTHTPQNLSESYVASYVGAYTKYCQSLL